MGFDSPVSRMRQKNKSPFTDGELEEIRAMLFKVAHTPGCITTPIYERKEYQIAYFAQQEKAMRLTKEEEERIAESEAVRLLESKGYKIQNKGTRTPYIPIRTHGSTPSTDGESGSIPELGTNSILVTH